MTSSRRFPRRIYDVGSEPDPRFTLANERTFLAWLRTSLALMAAGVALHALEVPDHELSRVTAAVVLLGLGVVASLNAWLSWARVEHAMRTGRPLPAPAAALPIVAGVVLAAVVTLVGLLL